MKITYDKSADAVYIYLVKTIQPGEASDTQGDWPFHVDQNSQHDILGIEVMDASTIFNSEFLSKCEHL